MKDFIVGDKVKIKTGTTAKIRSSSIIDLKLCPDLDGIVFTVKTLSKNKKGCFVSGQAFNEMLYSIPFRYLDKA